MLRQNKYKNGKSKHKDETEEFVKRLRISEGEIVAYMYNTVYNRNTTEKVLTEIVTEREQGWFTIYQQHIKIIRYDKKYQKQKKCNRRLHT